MVRTGRASWRLPQQPPNCLAQPQRRCAVKGAAGGAQRAPLTARRRGGYRWVCSLTLELTNRPSGPNCLSDHLSAFTDGRITTYTDSGGFLGGSIVGFMIGYLVKEYFQKLVPIR